MRIRSFRLLPSFFLLLLVPVLLFAEGEKRRVSVLAFSYTEGISKAEAKTLTSLFEAALIKTQVFDVIEQTEAATILQSQEYAVSDCVDESCAVSVGKMLAADHIFLGNTSTLGSKKIITIKLIDIEKGRSLKAESADAASLEKLSEEMATLANLMASGETTGGRGRVEMMGDEKTRTDATSPTKDVLVSVVFDSDPPEASFRVLDAGGKILFEGITPQAVRMAPAVYSIEASDAQGLYIPFREKLTVSAEGKMKYTIQLKPDFGSVRIDSDPSGADVLLNSMKVGSTPFSLEKVKKGKYDFMLRKDLYDSKTVSVKVDAGALSKVSEKLTAAFVQFSVREANGLSAGLKIDGKDTGRLPYTGKLPFRNFSIQVVPADSRFKPYDEVVSVRARGEEIERSVELEGRFGIVWVNTDPFLEAAIVVDSKESGTVPEEITLLIGDHEISVRGTLKGQVVSGTQKIVVKENESLNVTLKLAPDKYQKVIEGWTARLDELSGLMAQKARVGTPEVNAAQNVLDEISAAEFSFPDMKARTAVLVKVITGEKEKWERSDKIHELETSMANAAQELKTGKDVRSRRDVGGWTSLGLGTIFGGLSGLCFWLSEDAYGKYNTATYSSDAQTFRSQAELWDGLKIAGIITSGISLLLSPILLSNGPRPAEKEKELRGLEERLRSLRLEGEYYTTAEYHNRIQLELVRVQGGTFQMGSTSGYYDEQPVHNVTVSSFYISTYEVTQSQHQQVIGTNPSYFSGNIGAPNRPVEQVNWYDAVAFCNALSDFEGLQRVYTISGTTVTADWTKNGYRLPTEAEWEYAARGGNRSLGYAYSGSGAVNAVAWYLSNSGGTTHLVGTKAANELGFYDMSGNVWEWCWDWYEDYSGTAQTDPRGPSSGVRRIVRGGSCVSDDYDARSAYRFHFDPSSRSFIIGFRPVRRAD